MSYQELKSYQQAVIIQDFTVEFCKRYLNQFSRTVDQMEQAARSGKQNIVEGCSVSKTSPQTELMLIGVARGSLEELLEDYKDFLRQHKLEIWSKDDSRAIAVRQLAYRSDRSYKSYKSYRSYSSYQTHQTYLNDPEKAANAMIVLINQTNYLLDQQMRALKSQMEQKGISLIPHAQKVMMIIDKQRKNEEDFQLRLKEIVEKSRIK